MKRALICTLLFALLSSSSCDDDDPVKRLSYSKTVFSESQKNTGVFEYEEAIDTLFIGAANVEFSGTIGEDFISSEKLVVELDESSDSEKSLEGLTFRAILVYENDDCREKYSSDCDRNTNRNIVDDRDGDNRSEDISLAFTIEGEKKEHESVDGTSKLKLTFKDNAFEGNLDAEEDISASEVNLTLKFIDRASLKFESESDGTSVANNRQILVSEGRQQSTIFISLLNDLFEGNSGEDMVETNKVSIAGELPTGMTVRTELQIDKSVTLFLDNASTATPGEYTITVTFEDTAFTYSDKASDITNYSTDIVILVK